jgi:hypothetical protein
VDSTCTNELGEVLFMHSNTAPMVILTVSSIMRFITYTGVAICDFVLHYASCAQVCVRPIIDRYYNSYVLVPEAIETERYLLATERLLVIQTFPRSQYASIITHGNGKRLSYH